jgi:hypothetical protein
MQGIHVDPLCRWFRFISFNLSINLSNVIYELGRVGLWVRAVQGLNYRLQSDAPPGVRPKAIKDRIAPSPARKLSLSFIAEIMHFHCSTVLRRRPPAANVYELCCSLSGTPSWLALKPIASSHSDTCLLQAARPKALINPRTSTLNDVFVSNTDTSMLEHGNENIGLPITTNKLE